MISHVLTQAAVHASQPLHVVLSGVAGSTSLACWIVLLLPQLIEQWRLKSADGIAIGFISIWFLGDITNLAGAIWARLLPEVVFLAIWFCCADFLMIVSYYHYKHMTELRYRNIAIQEAATSILADTSTNAPIVYTGDNDNNDPTQPLLNRSNSIGPLHKTNSHHRRDSLAAILDAPPKSSILVQFVLPIIFVFACGALGYFISGSNIQDGDDIGIIPPIGEEPPLQLGPQVLGYISAALYLGARIPQIIQNHRKRSVEGLSLLFFIFSVLGNVTYAAQILLFRWDKAYVLLNLSWILGSIGTLFEDSIIFVQFYMYRKVDHHHHHHHHHHHDVEHESAILD